MQTENWLSLLGSFVLYGRSDAGRVSVSKQIQLQTQAVVINVFCNAGTFAVYVLRSREMVASMNASDPDLL